MKLVYDTEIKSWPLELKDLRVRRGYTKSSTVFLILIELLSWPVVLTGIMLPFGLIIDNYDYSKTKSDIIMGAFVVLLIGLFSIKYARNQLAKNKKAELCPTGDYPWNKSGYIASRQWQPVIDHIVSIIFIAFLFSEKNSWSDYILTVLLVSLVGCIFCDTAIKIAQAITFGHSRIIFDSFPYHLDEPIIIKWVSPKGLNELKEGVFTLRCVQETYSSDGESEIVDYHELWSGTWGLKEKYFQPEQIQHFHYEPPSELPCTHLTSNKPTYWEFKINLKTSSKLNFEETYLVPVYPR